MKKAQFAMAIILLGVWALISFPAQAKPKPPTPYPAPEIEMQAQAYPGPQPGLPGPEMPDMTTDEPRPGVPYVWGYLSDGRWWVTYDTGYFYPEPLTAMICITTFYSGARCLDLHIHSYYGELGRNLYSTDRFYKCSESGWYVYYAAIDGIVADIRQPNIYPIHCWYIPKLQAWQADRDKQG